MHEGAREDGAARRPRANGFLVEPDGEATRLLVALGRVVLAVSSLEKSLELELTRLLIVTRAAQTRGTDRSVPELPPGIENMTAGQLLKRLRGLGLPAHLDERIGDVINRRNQLANGQIRTGIVAFTPDGRLDTANTTLFSNPADPTIDFGASAAAAPGAGAVNWR